MFINGALQKGRSTDFCEGGVDVILFLRKFF